MPVRANAIGSVTVIAIVRIQFSRHFHPSMAKSVAQVNYNDDNRILYSGTQLNRLNIFRLLSAAKSELQKSKLPNSVLSKIWKLSDCDGDGFLDVEEFALAMHLINIKLDGNELPNILPDHLVPPSQRLNGTLDNGQ